MKLVSVFGFQIHVFHDLSSSASPKLVARIHGHCVPAPKVRQPYIVLLRVESIVKAARSTFGGFYSGAKQSVKAEHLLPLPADTISTPAKMNQTGKRRV